MDTVSPKRPLATIAESATRLLLSLGVGTPRPQLLKETGDGLSDIAVFDNHGSRKLLIERDYGNLRSVDERRGMDIDGWRYKPRFSYLMPVSAMQLRGQFCPREKSAYMQIAIDALFYEILHEPAPQELNPFVPGDDAEDALFRLKHVVIDRSYLIHAFEYFDPRLIGRTKARLFKLR